MDPGTLPMMHLGLDRPRHAGRILEAFVGLIVCKRPTFFVICAVSRTSKDKSLPSRELHALDAPASVRASNGGCQVFATVTSQMRTNGSGSLVIDFEMWPWFPLCVPNLVSMIKRTAWHTISDCTDCWPRC